MITTTTGCKANKMDEVKVPGNYNYAIRFEIDWDIFESGTYSYGPEGSTVHQMGGARLGYELFFDLTLDFKFKDGREYHEKIDLRPLIREMVKKHEIPDMTKTRWGGSATMDIKIEKNRLALDYQVSEFIKKENPPQMFYKDHYYPIFEKILN